jgi:hypothetical protein
MWTNLHSPRRLLSGQSTNRASIAANKRKRCLLVADAVEKGKNELTEIFPCVLVETGIS